MQAQQPLNILVAEDNEHDFKKISRALSKCDFQVNITRCIRAEEVIEIVNNQNTSFDLLLTDYMMPGMSGLELAEQLINQDVSFPIILITGGGDENIAVKALKLGVFDYLSKDIDAVFLELLPTSVSKAIQNNYNQRALQKAEDTNKKLSSALEQSQSAILIVDLKENILYMNVRYEQLSGYSQDEVVRQNIFQLFDTSIASKTDIKSMWSKTVTGLHQRCDLKKIRVDGDNYWVTLSMTKIEGAQKDASFILFVEDSIDEQRKIHLLESDIQSRILTEKKLIKSQGKEKETSKELAKKVKELEFKAHYDVLTKLPNRTLLTDRFKQALAHSNRTENMLAICFLDLDGFKSVNDNYGHDIGDRLLIEVADRLTETIREEDTVSRQGGDEFALLLNDIESFVQCEQILERIRHELAQPYIIGDYIHNISVSIGTTIYPLDDADLDTLLRHADQAMYQAKLAGKNQHQLFNALHDKETIDKQIRLQEIKQALVNKEFELYYQPKVNMKTGKVFGVEALIRWIHPEEGLIPPLDFLPLIEGTELELQVGGWVMNQALSQLDNWQQHDIKLEVSINISSHHLQSDVFFDQLNEALNKHPSINSQEIQLEILESSALGDLDAISNIIKNCQNVLGVNFALDDFGTGYSTLTHIKNLSANTIKIDQTFVRDLLDDPHDYSIIEGIIGLAKSFNHGVIAEGVETTEQGLMLLVMGCNEAQGYCISGPLPADDLVTWLADYKPNLYWIDYGLQQFTLQEHKILLLQLTTRHWFNRINKALITKEKSGFGQDIVKCHLSVWLSRFEDEQIFNQAWLEQLKKTHDELFDLASELINQHQAGQIDDAVDRIDEFKLSYETIHTHLDDYLQYSAAKD